MRISGAKAVINTLKEQGVEVVFGYPGANIAPLYDELKKSGIRHVLTRSEQAAGHAACGYAASGKKTCVCFATSGPGAVNLITAVANASADSVPMVIFTGQVETGRIGTDAFQEADITGATMPFSKYNFLIKNPSDIIRNVREAFYIASTGRKGPVLIDIPFNIQTEEIDTDDEAAEFDLPGYKVPGNPKLKELNEAANLINQASKPLIVAGGGVFASGAEEALKLFMESFNIPAVYSMMGRGAVASEKLNLGMAGVYGSDFANKAVIDSDLLILAGSRATERTLMGINKKSVHIDIDPAEQGKNIDSLGVTGDLKAALNALMLLVKRKEQSIKKEPENLGFHEGLDPIYFFSILSDNLKDEIITADVGQNLIWALKGIKDSKRIIMSGGLGAMGFALPAAIGAATESKKDGVVICGDGGFQMSLSELATAASLKLNLKVIIMDNSSLGMIRELQKDEYNENYSAVDLTGPKLKYIAKAYGASYGEISKNEEAENELGKMMNTEGIYILRVITDPDESAFRGQHHGR
ncbi:MAG: thiamine pyrophosphate-binding protein [Bacillota bacterium]|nr:thiamine pyrophosphate-binding protein [Bacillota bacterium]